MATDDQILRFIEKYRTKWDQAPTVREICEHTGHKNPSSIQAILARLERDGLIERRPGIPRSVRVVRGKAQSEAL